MPIHGQLYMGIWFTFVWTQQRYFSQARPKKYNQNLLLDTQEASDLPKWNFDGSSTNQASGTNSDVFLIPVALFDDPFRGKPNKMVLCDTYTFDDQPTCSNHRKTCLEVMNTEAVKVIISLSRVSYCVF